MKASAVKRYCSSCQRNRTEDKFALELLTCDRCHLKHARKRAARPELAKLRYANDKRANPGKFKQRNREMFKRHQYRKSIVNIMRKYGVTEPEAIALDTVECCQICNVTLVRRERLTPQSATIDHCHATGRVRGVLCSRCNLGLGYFRDNPENLANAVSYLDHATSLESLTA
jgi:hypothetical protein